MWKPETRPCPLCGSGSRKSLGKRGGAAHHAGKGVETDVVECRDCGGIYAFPTMIPVGNPYSGEADHYFDAHADTAKAAAGRYYAERAEQLLGRVGSILELGCGRGGLLVGAKSRNWDVSGVDMTPEFSSAARERGVEVETATIEECAALDREGAYDVILLAAVLEHIYEPMPVLRRVFNALKPGGLVFIHVPNERALALRVGEFYRRLQGRRWSLALSPTFSPYHVTGFTPSSLRRALTGLGYEIARFDCFAFKNMAPKSRPLERFAMGAFQSIGAKLGQGDGIEVWARRPHVSRAGHVRGLSTVGPPLALGAERATGHPDESQRL